MMDYRKYRRHYYLPPEDCRAWTGKDCIDTAPLWCSVDLRDGNQALVVPMSLEEKLKFFRLLVDIGFKEIEVGFPAASDTEYRFIRTLIEKDMIPEDVTIQVLTQAREHIIRKTFDAVRGARKAIVHLYNSTSPMQRDYVFGKSKEEILQIAVSGAELIERLRQEEDGNIRYEYSPESFTATEPEYALEVCNAVLDVWRPSADNRVIINLPSTVQLSMPHVYASQIEYMSRHLKYREHVVLSLHPHNDRGTGVADAELGVLAGAQRIEGTLFGNGERTGNVDIITLAMNLYSHGVDCGLDLEKLDHICETYEKCTGMKVEERRPYTGALVFAAFSGSHQDAIAKCIKHMEESGSGIWEVPYLPIDPADIGRSYDTNVIRINSQSGKGGVEFVLEQHYGLRLPVRMREAMGYAAKEVSDTLHKELTPEEVFDVFVSRFENRTDPYEINEIHFKQHNGIIAEVTTTSAGRRNVVISSGNGRLDAVSNALRKFYHLDYSVVTYEEHALERSSSSRAIAYVGIENRSGKLFWGAGIDVDIVKASISALLTAVNNMAASSDG